MDDERIIALIRDGHPEAFEELVVRYQKQSHFWALRYMKQWDEANEVTQMAFIKLYTFILKSKKKIEILPWMRKVVTNLCLDKQKSKKWKFFFKNAASSVKPNFDVVKKEDPLEAIGDTRLSPERTLLNKELGKNIEELIERLPNQQRKIFFMKHFEGLKIKDIAQQLQISEGHIKSQLFRAVHTLRKGLGEFYEG